MRKEGKKQSKFKHYISSPFRILKKAKELYIKGLVGCAGRISCDAAAVSSAVQISHIPPDPQTKSVIKLNADERVLQINETRLITHGGERSRNVGNDMGSFRQRQRIVGYNKYNYYNRRRMSYQTDQVRKMGRIDEDKPCYFEEDGNYHSKPNLLYLYPRSRINV